MRQIPKNNQDTCLYVVATPIGNMEDITLRAIKILKQTDLIAAEDTRHTGKLLRFYNIKTPLISFHEYNEERRTPELIKKLKTGIKIALVSDAGTPTVADPGFRLVKEAIANTIKVIPIPGVSAPITALSAAGMPTDRFIFIGFPSPKKIKRRLQLHNLTTETATLVFYMSPKRLTAFLQELIDIWGDRNAVLCREMTKIYEEFIRGCLSEIMINLQQRPTIKGECTLLVSGFKQDKTAALKIARTEIQKEMARSGVKISVLTKKISQKYGVPRNEVYAAALNWKRETED
ncbi:16S rRNA (cytidine(1402)-2'-O)-methyltransferase [Desulfococcaceae bacterium HSG9]|nr:16S rRNA (cytidine(1402)-2'-O)-methyltransferase [Desulfococcaceae bacterium HSG9]